MANFLTHLDVRCRNDGTWILIQDLQYQSAIIDDVIVVPAGFQTDFASVPRVPIFYTLFGDRAHRESVVHDYLYRIDARPSTTFNEANDIFLEAMAVRGKGFFVRYAMYWGVCLGGCTAWHKKMVGDSI